MKKAISILLAITLCLSLSIPALASDVGMETRSVMSKFPIPPKALPVLEDGETLDVGVYYLGDGIIVEIGHIDPEEETRLNVSKTMDLTTSTWKWFLQDTPISRVEVKVYNNSSNNPGLLNVCLKLKNGAGTEYPIYNVAQGDYALFSEMGIGYGMGFDIWLSASTSGSYKVKAKDTILWP